ncbi:hypothetical protein HMI54_010941 [Coelomomyces lativittatus]|nr:hypothetical protein HMI56_002435 [Coelomomyces lativittatus]KAJ1516070.1 hypothetical protein HMI54_010941 [Coelomomyces lativittatus]
MVTGKQLHSYECEGFVQCVQWIPTDTQLFVHGTTRKVLGVVDQRTHGPGLQIKTEAMVNSIYIYRDGTYIYTGDALGQLKVWDVRTLTCMDSQFNETAHKPISHVALSKAEEDDEPRFLAVNSYDNVIRVYDRGLAPPRSQNRLLHSLKGHKNKNWPIKSAFYNGDDFVVPSFKRTNSLSDQSDLLDASLPTEKVQEESCMVLATGSADPFAYIYAMGTSEGQSEMLQRLEGHTDRVYAVAFHPFESILATCSADFTVKIWSSTGRGKRVFSL